MNNQLTAFRADGGDVSQGRIKEIADNAYGDEEKRRLAQRLLAADAELQEHRKAEAVEVTFAMAYAFHHALTDSPLGSDEAEEIKTGLRAALANVTALQLLNVRECETCVGTGKIPAGWQLVPIEPTEAMIINGFESEPDEFFSESRDWEAYQEMSGCEQAAHRAKLCYAAMLAAAPAAAPQPPTYTENDMLTRLAVIMSGSDTPGEIRSLTVTAQSLVDRCKYLQQQWITKETKS